MGKKVDHWLDTEMDIRAWGRKHGRKRKLSFRRIAQTLCVIKWFVWDISFKWSMGLVCSDRTPDRVKHGTAEATNDHYQTHNTIQHNLPMLDWDSETENTEDKGF